MSAYPENRKLKCSKCGKKKEPRQFYHAYCTACQSAYDKSRDWAIVWARRKSKALAAAGRS